MGRQATIWLQLRPIDMVDSANCGWTRSKSMTQRRQALRQGKTAATSAFFLILAFFSMSPSISAQAEPVTSQAIPSMEALRVLPAGVEQATLIAALLVA